MGLVIHAVTGHITQAIFLKSPKNDLKTGRPPPREHVLFHVDGATPLCQPDDKITFWDKSGLTLSPIFSIHRSAVVEPSAEREADQDPTQTCTRSGNVAGRLKPSDSGKGATVRRSQSSLQGRPSSSATRLEYLATTYFERRRTKARRRRFASSIRSSSESNSRPPAQKHLF